MTILEMLGQRVIPWVHEQGMHRLVIADDQLHQEVLPEGMTIVHKKLRGRRVAAKGPRKYGNHSNTVAEWPEEGVREDLLPYIICVLAGRVEFRVNNFVIQCGEGHFVLIPPRAAYSAKVIGEDVKPGQVPDLMAFQSWNDHLQCGLAYSTRTKLFFPNTGLITQLDLLIEEALSRRPGSEPIVINMFAALLGMMHRDLTENRYFGHSLIPASPSNQPGANDAIERVQRFVKSNLSQPLSTEAAAIMALMSRSQFVKRFREATGQSYIEYVTYCRIEETKMLLIETDWTVTAIREFVGFKDETRLRQIFSAAVGMGLIEYRNAHRTIAKTGAVLKNQ